MAILLAALVGLAVGAVAGGLITAWWLRKGATAVAAPEPAPASRPPAASAPEATADEDLKPVLDATRGVLSELEQRYQGTRAAGDGEAKKPRQPRRRA